MSKDFKDFSYDDAVAFLGNNVGALLLVDAQSDSYKSLVKKGFFSDFIEER